MVTNKANDNERGFILLNQSTPNGNALCIAVSHNGAKQESLHQMSQTAIDLAVKERLVVIAENATTDVRKSVDHHSNLHLQVRFVADKYVHSRGVRSLLCIPIQKATLLEPHSPELRSSHETNLLGVVYIENNTFSGAFLPARIPVLLTIVRSFHLLAVCMTGRPSGISISNQHGERNNGASSNGVFERTAKAQRRAASVGQDQERIPCHYYPRITVPSSHAH